MLLVDSHLRRFSNIYLVFSFFITYRDRQAYVNDTWVYTYPAWVAQSSVGTRHEPTRQIPPA